MQATSSKSRRKEIESLALPVILLLTGLILLGGDRAGVLSLDRIQNLWPVALLLVGLSDLLTNCGEEIKSPFKSTSTSREGTLRD